MDTTTVSEFRANLDLSSAIKNVEWSWGHVTRMHLKYRNFKPVVLIRYK